VYNKVDTPRVKKKTKKKKFSGEIGVYAKSIYSNSRFNIDYNWKSLDDCLKSKRISLWTLINLFISLFEVKPSTKHVIKLEVKNITKSSLARRL
jgi:hypothetical protein